MTGNRKTGLRGIAQPILVREPLFVRFCSAFVDNLTLMLRTAFVIGALFLVQDLQIKFEQSGQPVAEIQTGHSASTPRPAEPTRAEAPVLSDGVRHALNCTFEDFRNENFDECVNGPSRVYQRPDAEEDDTSHNFYAVPVLFASLDGRSNTE